MAILGRRSRVRICGCEYGGKEVVKQHPANTCKCMIFHTNQSDDAIFRVYGKGEGKVQGNRQKEVAL